MFHRTGSTVVAIQTLKNACQTSTFPLFTLVYFVVHTATIAVQSSFEYEVETLGKGIANGTGGNNQAFH